MKVKCISKQMKEYTQQKLFLFSTPLINWDVEVDKLYTVYGISVWMNEITYLLTPESSDPKDRPNWYPAELFEVNDNSLPKMYFNYLEDDPNALKAIWGYEELVSDNSHYKGLLEREVPALEIFYKRKDEFDRQENN